jgi:hypothetical protein
MSRQYYNDPYGPFGRRVTIQSHQPSDSSFRRNVPPTSRDFASQSTFQPNQERNPPPPPPYYRGEYSHFDEYPNSVRSSPNRTNVSQRFLLMKEIFNIFNIRIHRIINQIDDID